MCYVDLNNKRTFVFIIFFFILISIFTLNDCSRHNIHFAYADNQNEVEQELNENVEEIIKGIDTKELETYFEDEIFYTLSNGLTFGELIKSILSGEMFVSYDNFAGFICSSFIDNIKSLCSTMLVIFAIIVIYKMFSQICCDKYLDFKKCIKYSISLIILLIIVVFSKNLLLSIKQNIEKIFNFTSILFPILLSLVLSSGGVSSYSIYSGLSVFVFNLGSYIITYVLFPIASAILILSLFQILSNDFRFKKIIELLKYIFKTILVILFSVFGLFSAISVISSGTKDGISQKVTKYAIKNYVPVVGGYIADGLDLIKTSSVIIKNSFGVCGVIGLFVIMTKPLILLISTVLVFKILSVFCSFIDEKFYADVFEDYSRSISNFVSLLVVLFFILLVFIFLIMLSVSITV